MERVGYVYGYPKYYNINKCQITILIISVVKTFFKTKRFAKGNNVVLHFTWQFVAACLPRCRLVSFDTLSKPPWQVHVSSITILAFLV